MKDILKETQLLVQEAEEDSVPASQDEVTVKSVMPAAIQIFQTARKGGSFKTGDRPGHQVIKAKKEDISKSPLWGGGQPKIGDVVVYDWNDTGDLLGVIKSVEEMAKFMVRHWKGHIKEMLKNGWTMKQIGQDWD